ncbi:MAG TPA: B12-binding domain-containing protein, partial [Candidatus Thermoplasmatota archaeon]|nr:B12-binding domain-containing protein [Candidatus Thermoplasmatota archaeon]
MQPVLQAIYDSILNGQHKVTPEEVSRALAEGIDPVTVLNESMVAAMAEVGRLFEEGEYYVPEMLIAARAMQSGLAVLKPRLVQAHFQPIARVAAGTVKGDL